MSYQIQLHSYRRCPFAIRVRMTLEEKNLPYTVIEENLSDFSEDLLRLHPEGKVPLLIYQANEDVKTEQVIFESSIITEFLDETFPNPPLMPSFPTKRAEIRLWTYWCNEIFKPDLDQYKYDLHTLDEAKREGLFARMKAHLLRLESALEKGPYIMGPMFTLADIHIFPFYRQLQRAKPNLEMLSNYPKLIAWSTRITQSPCFERAMSQRS